MDRRSRILLVGVVVLICAAMPWLTNAAVDIRSFMCSLALSVAPFPMCRQISRSLARATKRDHEAAADEHERATEEAFARGEESVLALVRLARDDARAQLAAVASGLEPDLAVLVSSRLKEVDRRLESLASGG